VTRFVKESVFPVSVEALFALHERPDILEILQPPWEDARVVRPPKSLAVGTIVEMKSKVGPLWVTIVAEHVAYEKNVRFEDRMIRGPFRSWHHRHLFAAVDGGSTLRDEIDYELPLGPLGRLVEPVAVRPRLRRLFDYRHEATRRALG
jgi:ligand-binding SRPBCC domain-containing protein